MVVLKDIRNMFWGVTIDGGKRYSQTVERSFHISMAALEPSSAKGPVSLMILHEKAEFLLCTLDTKNIYQQTLDLNFTEGEEVTFFLTGSGICHLTGYLVEDEEDIAEYTPSMDSDGFESSDEEEAPELVPASKADKAADINIKRKLANIFTNIPEKKRKNHQYESESEESDDDSDDEDFIVNEALEDSDEDSEEQDEFQGEDDEEEEGEEGDEEEIPPPAKQKLSKKSKQEKKKDNETSRNQSKVSTPNATPTSSKSPQPKSPKVEVTESGEATVSTKKKQKKIEEVTESGEATVSTKKKKKKIEEVTESGDAPESAKKKKKRKKKNKDGEDGSANGPQESGTKSKPQTPSTPKKKVVSGGTVVEEIKVGHGQEAKAGKMVHVYYMGKLMSGKQFDSCTSGKPFRFKLGKQEVIKGWDNGVAGMKVGGKRRLTVPAQQGYGNQRQGPIPPNSTLIFEVELKAVS